MDTARFDGLTKACSRLRSRRAVVRALASGAAGGLLAVRGGRRAGAAGTKVRLCHRTSSPATGVVVLTVSAAAVEAHLAHGDVVLGDDHDGNVCCVHAGDCGAGLECCPDGRCDNDCGFD